MTTLTVLELLDAPSHDEVDVEALAHALSRPRVRDAVLAHAVGHTTCAHQILDGQAPPARWLLVGPIDPTRVSELRPLMARLHDAAALEGGTPAWAAASISAYLDWISGRTVAAVRRLEAIPTEYEFASLLRTLIATGHPLPEARQHECCTWRSR